MEYFFIFFFSLIFLFLNKNSISRYVVGRSGPMQFIMKCPKGKHDNGGFLCLSSFFSFFYKKKYPREIAAAHTILLKKKNFKILLNECERW